MERTVSSARGTTAVMAAVNTTTTTTQGLFTKFSPAPGCWLLALIHPCPSAVLPGTKAESLPSFPSPQNTH